MAPEFVTYANDSEELQSPMKPTKAGDTYSFGCVMLQVRLMVITDSLISLPWSKIFSGKEPYSRIKTMVRVISGIGVGEQPFHRVDINNMDEAYRPLSLRCLSMKPESRPSIIEITTILDPVKTLAIASSPLPTWIFGVFKKWSRAIQYDTETSNSTHPRSE